MKLPKLPVDFFNPSPQRTTMLERNDWFIPIGEGPKEEKELTVKELYARHDKVKKVIKAILIVLGAAAFVVLGYYFFRDYTDLTPPKYFNYF